MNYSGAEIHPRVLELVFKLQSNMLEHSNQICIATLLALKEFLGDYRIKGADPKGSTRSLS